MIIQLPDSFRLGPVAWLRRGVDAVVRWFFQVVDRWIGGRRAPRFLALLSIYTVELAVAFYLAYELRWDFGVPSEFVRQRLELIGVVVVCKLLLLQSFGQFRSLLTYFGLADFSSVVMAMGVAVAFMLGLWTVAAIQAAPPRGVILMDFVLSISLLSAFRIFLRVLRTWNAAGRVRVDAAERRVAIIGATDVGEALAKDLISRRQSGLVPLFFIDDEPSRIGRSIHGLPVYGPLERLAELAPAAQIQELVITLPAASPKRIKAIVDLGLRLGVSTQIVPSFTQLASGQVKVERSRPVAIEDLLGRDPVKLDSVGIAQLIRDRVVWVTGAGGSIGSELCRQILALEPRQLVLVEQTEIALFEIEQELLARPTAGRILPLIADVADQAAVRALFERARPGIIFHAAAHKHVPLMERQPGEALKNNTLATAALARLAGEYGVERFVFISTDKAINPTSVMGCSKRLAEKAVQAQQNAAGNRTVFLAVRFGNVLGSSGSVIPVFKRQIAQGGPVTVTHPEMTRYFMTIPEAVGLVLQTATLGRGGEIFILDMAKPVKILDVARQMIELSGYKPDVDIEIKITGLRPGEKLYEELRHTDELHETTEHPRIFKLRNDSVVSTETVEVWLRTLREVAGTGDAGTIKATMKQLVPEYTPFEE